MAGDAILHPVTLAAVGLLLVNDHVLKAAYPGVVTGKLSDIAGLAFFPLLLVGLWEIGLAALGRWSRPAVRPVVVAVLSGVALFVLIKTTAAGSDAFGTCLGIGQWIPDAIVGLLTGNPVGGPTRAPSVTDPTDLLALPAIALPLAIGLARTRPTPTAARAAR